MIQEFQRKIDAIDVKLEKLVDAYLDELYPVLVNEKSEKLKAKKETLNIQIRKMYIAEIKRVLCNIRDFEINDLNGKKMFVNTFINKILINKNKKYSSF